MFSRLLLAISSSLALLILGCSPESNDTVNTTPHSSMIFSNDTQSNMYFFDASQSTDAQNDTLTFLWELDNKQFNTASFMYTFTQAGDYFVKLTVTDTQGLLSSRSVTIIVTMPKSENIEPSAFILHSNDEQVNKYTFDGSDSVDADGDTLSYTWSIDSKIFAGQSVDYTFATNGLYAITLTVDDSNGGLSSQTINVNVSMPSTIPTNQAPVALFSFNQLTDSLYSFDASQSSDPDSDEITYLWNIDGKLFTTKTFSYEFETSKTHQVELTVNDGQLNSAVYDLSVVVTLPVNNPPVIDTSITTDFLKVMFDASQSTDTESDDLSYEWIIDSVIYTSAVANHTFASAGQYNYSLNVSDGVNTAQTSGTVSVATVDIGNVAPVAKMAINKLELLISFSGSASTDQDGDALTYLWTIDGQSFTTVSGIYTFTQNGEYPITLKVTDSEGESHEITQSVSVAVEVVNTAPIARFDTNISNLTIELDAQISTDAEGDDLTYLWTVDNTNYTTVNIEHTFDQSGTYPVSLKVTDSNGASHQITQEVTVTEIVNNNTAPVARFTTDINGFIVTFDASTSSDADGDSLEYIWQFSGQNPEGVTTEYTFSTAQTYSIKLTVRDTHGAEHTIFGSVSVSEPDNYRPTALFSATPTGLEVQLDATESNDTDGTVDFYIWTIEGDDHFSASPTHTHTFDTAGTYTILLKVEDDYGDSDTYSLDLTVEVGDIQNKAPAAYILTSPQFGGYILFNGNNSYDDDGDDLQFAWELASGEVFNGSKFYYKALSTAAIDATLILSDGIDRTIETVSLNPSNDTIDRDYEIELFEAASSYLKCEGCHNSSRPFTELGDMSDYDGDIRSRVSSSGIGLETLYSYPVDRVSHNGSGTITSEASKTHWLNLLRLVDADVNGANQPPVPDFSYSVSGNEVTFTNESTDTENNNLSYEWDFGDFETSTDTDPVHRFVDTQMYVVKLTVNDGNTFKTVHKRIEF